jgi:hypothetical protein
MVRTCWPRRRATAGVSAPTTRSAMVSSRASDLALTSRLLYFRSSRCSRLPSSASRPAASSQNCCETCVHGATVSMLSAR